MISGYGLENEILVYANLNKFFPILSGYDHGWAMREFNAISSTKRNSSKFHLVWNKRMLDGIKKNLKTKIPIISSCPYKLYKERKNLKSLKDKSSLFFFSHSTQKISLEQSTEEIINSFKHLPNELIPKDICLHWHDYSNKRLVNFLENENFRVLCAGNIYKKNYIKNFYKILINYNNCISNQLGTYTLLSIDLGIPFTLIEPEPIYNNFGGDRNVPLKYKISDFPFGKKAREFFLNKYSIDNNQLDLVKNELGYHDRESPKQIKKILILELISSFKNLELNKTTKYYLKKIFELYNSIK